jgi:anaerobic selenocysteine-containing dehydrogenase
MLHVLLEEELYDATFARQWTNGAFLVRADTHQLLTAHDLSPAGQSDTCVVWDERSGGPVDYHPDRG